MQFDAENLKAEILIIVNRNDDQAQKFAQVVCFDAWCYLLPGCGTTGESSSEKSRRFRRVERLSRALLEELRKINIEEGGFCEALYSAKTKTRKRSGGFNPGRFFSKTVSAVALIEQAFGCLADGLEVGRPGPKRNLQLEALADAIGEAFVFYLEETPTATCNVDAVSYGTFARVLMACLDSLNVAPVGIEKYVRRAAAQKARRRSVVPMVPHPSADKSG